MTFNEFLQEIESKTIFRYDSNTGRSEYMPLPDRCKEFLRRLAFLCQEYQIDVDVDQDGGVTLDKFCEEDFNLRNGFLDDLYINNELYN